MADGPCCQFQATSSALAPGARRRMSKYVVLVRLLPEKVVVTVPPRRTVAESNVMLVTLGITPAEEIEFGQGAFIEVTQRLFSNVFAPGADRFKISNAKGVFSGALFDARMGGLPAIVFPRITLRFALVALMRMPVTFPVTIFSSIRFSP